MNRSSFRSLSSIQAPASYLAIGALFSATVFFQIVSNLLYYLPLSVVFPITTGLTVVGIQIVAARLLLSESIAPLQWFGSFLVVIGIIFIGGRR